MSHFATGFSGTDRMKWTKCFHRSWGTVVAVPLPLRPSEPALCGSCTLVTPY